MLTIFTILLVFRDNHESKGGGYMTWNLTLFEI